MRGHHQIHSQHPFPHSVNAGSLFVLLGEYDFGVDSGSEQLIVASELIMHEHYDGQTYTNDVALLRLLATIIYSDLIQPIDLPEPMDSLPEGTMFTTVGWGTTFSGGSLSNVLRKVS